MEKNLKFFVIKVSEGSLIARGNQNNGGTMSKKLSALLTSTIVTGLLSSGALKAQDADSKTMSNDEMSSGKNGCKGMSASDKNSCKGKKKEDELLKKKKKMKDKNSCKNGCGEAKNKSAEESNQKN